MANKVVVDSSVIVKWLNKHNELYSKQAQQILTDTQNQKIDLFLPELVKYEVGNALLHKQLDLPQTKASLSPLYQIPITWVQETEQLAKQTLTIAMQQKITYYDACFLALAKSLNAKLITANPRHQKHSGVTLVQIAHYR